VRKGHRLENWSRLPRVDWPKYAHFAKGLNETKRLYRWLQRDPSQRHKAEGQINKPKTRQKARLWKGWFSPAPTVVLHALSCNYLQLTSFVENAAPGASAMESAETPKYRTLLPSSLGSGQIRIHPNNATVKCKICKEYLFMTTTTNNPAENYACQRNHPVL